MSHTGRNAGTLPHRAIYPRSRHGRGLSCHRHQTQAPRRHQVCEPEFVRRFEREARAIAAPNHHNICTQYESDPAYLVMELVDGPTLATRISRTGQLALRTPKPAES